MSLKGGPVSNTGFSGQKFESEFESGTGSCGI
jgi:hypothetical protein